MPGADQPPHLALFENFELDVRAGELHGLDGATVRLPEQLLRILVLLLEHPGEVVQREEIRKKLWPNDTWCYSGKSRLMIPHQSVAHCPGLQTPRAQRRDRWTWKSNRAAIR